MARSSRSHGLVPGGIIHPFLGLDHLLAMPLFAIFHGYAHGEAMPTIPDPGLNFGGFLTGTAALHITGLIIGDISQHHERGKLLLRLAGGVTAACGVGFLVGVL